MSLAGVIDGLPQSQAALDKNRAPLGPEVLSTAGTGV